MPDDRIEIGEFRKNSREVVLVAVQTFRSVETIDLRIWAVDRGGHPLATQKGIALRPEQIPELIALLERAMEQVGGGGAHG